MTHSNQDLLRTIFRNSFWGTFASVASPILAFLFGGLTIRYVGIEAAGFSMAVGSILGIAGQFGTLGIGDAILPAMAAAIAAGDRLRVRRLIGTLLLATAFSSCITAAAIVTFAGPIIDWTRTSIPSSVANAFIAITAVTTIVGSLTGTMMGILRSACRHDLVTKTVLPLSILSGVTGCILVPLFPSLLTVALIGCCGGLITLPIFFTLARRIVPETVRPAFSLAEFPSLARYGFWISLTRILSAMMGGVDDLVITAACGAAALPPWSICKKLCLTVHTFLAQHVEHLIPTLGAVREKSRQTFESINAAMHWYVAVVAAAGYTFMAWAGPAIIAATAGSRVAGLCEIPLSSCCIVGILLALNIIPVISALALSDAKPGFVISLFSNSAQLVALVLLVRTMGVPAAYYAPLFAIPFFVATLGTSSARLLDPGLAWQRIRPVLVPAAYGLAGVAASLLVPTTVTLLQRAAVGALLAPCVLALIIATEYCLGINAEPHRQLIRVLRHAFSLAGIFPRALRGILFPGTIEKVMSEDGRNAV
jgi:O-antigen/teichoic acid export membrane protein